ncbi:LPS-assembly protein LptD [Dechloromonas sp.]|uniref:LPS-assembly protein LptD n=1 Tax=Dechloromonas sp. TaxID=1917218 RepID=UPI00120A3797|nr:LPS-assembly protein LptD [Dechloromonas sp.]MBU3697245.1 LPS-assembly protein LptD [Dechloromonas sp.]TEX44169.1 MAG: LPS biosynthesis protein [Rhodocyclaceae bacterium]
MFAAQQTSLAATDPLPRASGALMQEGSGGAPLLLSANDTVPVRLRVERKFNVLGKKKKPLAQDVGVDHPVELKKGDDYPLFVVADQIEGRTDDVTEAVGNVELRKAGSLLYADKVLYRPLDDEIEATGEVRLLQDGAEVKTPYLRMKLSEQIGFAEQAEYRIVREVPSKVYRQQQIVVTAASNNATTAGAPMMLNVPNSYGLPTTLPPRRPSEAAGTAERVDFEGENQITLNEATYSTCKPGQTDWYLQSSEMHLDYDEDVGNAKHASVWFGGVPIFYSPYTSFALNHKRRSGFLHPFYSASTKNGFDITLPYYWNIAPNYDVTLYPRYMGKRGVQLGGEAQYLDYNYRGTWRGEYLPDDEAERRKRYAYNIQHVHNLGRGVSALVNWQAVSDDRYWEDLSSRLLQTSATQLPRQLVLGYAPLPGIQSSMQVLRYQTLQPDPNNPIARPYFLEPQLNVLGYKPNVLKTDLSMIGQFSRFVHPDKVQGDRLVFYPQVSLPIVHPAFQITPKLGMHLTKYALNQQVAGEPTSLTRSLPTLSLDSTVIFEREGKLLDREYIQTLEPRLYYVNIPYKDQSRIPVFDSGLTDFNFAQMFSENRYSGFDRINDANQLTAALTTRILDGTTGAERFKAMIGQRYYFRDQRVTIPGETPRTADFSNTIAAINGLVAPKTYADMAWEFNDSKGVTERFATGLRFQPDYGKVLSTSYRYTRDALTGKPSVDQIDIAGQWPLSSRWYAVGRYNYSLLGKQNSITGETKGGQLLEAIAGLEYNTGCWAARVVAQRLEAVSGTPNTSVFFQLELTDFASIGSNPIGLLRRTIPGYGKVNELPGNSLLTSQ